MDWRARLREGREGEQGRDLKKGGSERVAEEGGAKRAREDGEDGSNTGSLKAASVMPLARGKVASGGAERRQDGNGEGVGIVGA